MQNSYAKIDRETLVFARDGLIRRLEQIDEILTPKATTTTQTGNNSGNPTPTPVANATSPASAPAGPKKPTTPQQLAQYRANAKKARAALARKRRALAKAKPAEKAMTAGG